MYTQRATHRAYPENRFVPIKLIHIYPDLSGAALARISDSTNMRSALERLPVRAASISAAS
jgi:hypothetical protein